MKLKVTVDGKVYDVVVDVDEDHLSTIGMLPLAGATAPPINVPAHVKAPANEEKSLRAPIAGIVTKVIVEAGAKVDAGETLIVLEAMKMETEITAPAAGTAATVEVSPGESVQGGQLLVTWE